MPEAKIFIHAIVPGEDCDYSLHVESVNSDPFEGPKVDIQIETKSITVDAHDLLRAIKACSGIKYDD